MDIKTAKRKYTQHKHNAGRRAIAFDLTFQQWLDVWGSKIDQMGVRADQYGMCRFMDRGPYAVGNVYIGKPKRNGYTRRLVNHDRHITSVWAEHNAVMEPPDEIQENPWLPKHLRRSFSSSDWIEGGPSRRNRIDD